MPNHLLGYRRTFIRLEFNNVSELLNVRKVLMPIAEKNKKNVNAMDAYAEVVRFVLLISTCYIGANCLKRECWF